MTREGTREIFHDHAQQCTLSPADTEHGWEALAAQHAYTGEGAWTAASPNGGLHFFFRYTEEASGLRVHTDLPCPGIDIRCNRGYIIVAPSFNQVLTDKSACQAGGAAATDVRETPVT